METQNLVQHYLSTRMPLVVIQSIEPTRMMSLITECVNHMRTPTLFEHSLSDGIRELLTRQLHSEDTPLALTTEQVRFTFKSRANANLILTDMKNLDQENSMPRYFAELVRLAGSRRGIIILISSSLVRMGLSRSGMSVAPELPNKGEVHLVMTGTANDHRQVMQIEWGDTEVTRATEILTDITEMEAINVVVNLVTKGVVRSEGLSELDFFKNWIFGGLNDIEYVPLREDFTIDGLGNLKDQLRPREQLMKANLTDTLLHPPKGVLLAGVPGCDRSLSAKVTALQWRLPPYRLDMASVLGMYVGQSEGGLQGTFATTERVALCALWIDEIEEGLVQESNGGTTRRLVGQFLFWMQELTAKVFTVTTANDVSIPPPELLRKGRFDELFFVDLPEAPDREETTGLHFRKYLGVEPSQELLADLVTLTDGFSGLDIDMMIHDIATKVYADQVPGLPPEPEIRKFFTNVAPFSQTNSEDLAAIRSWGNI